MGSTSSKSKYTSVFETEPEYFNEKAFPFARNVSAKELYCDKSFFASIIAIFSLLLGGALIIHLIEGPNPPWNYLNCVYFCTVTITTIGFGDLTPVTVGGKLFVMFYTVIGLGVIAYALSIISQKFVDTADFTWEITRRFRRKKKKHAFKSLELSDISNFDEEERRKKASNRKRGIMYNISKGHKLWIAVAFYGIMLLVGAAIFNSLETTANGEPWGYFNSIYFCFVALSTIGYGDFRPRREVTKIVFIFYVLLGLGFIYFILQLIGRRFLKDLGKRAHKELASDGTIVDQHAFVTSDMVLQNLSLQMGELSDDEKSKVWRKIQAISTQLE